MSQMTDPQRTSARRPATLYIDLQRTCRSGVSRRRRRPAPAILGAALHDHFALYWEVTPHRLTASPQVKAIVPVWCR